MTFVCRLQLVWPAVLSRERQWEKVLQDSFWANYHCFRCRRFPLLFTSYCLRHQRLAIGSQGRGCMKALYLSLFFMYFPVWEGCSLLPSWFPGRLARSAALTSAPPLPASPTHPILSQFLSRPWSRRVSRGSRQFTFDWGYHTGGEAFKHTHARASLLSLSHAQNARTPACSLSVSQTSAGSIQQQQQRELPDSLLSISRHAAEKEEFHFWSLRRVRTYILHDFPEQPQPLAAHRCVCV